MVDQQIAVICTIPLPNSNCIAHFSKVLQNTVNVYGIGQHFSVERDPVCGSQLKTEQSVVVIAVHAQQLKLYILVGAVKLCRRRSDQSRQLFRIFRCFFTDQALEECVQSAVAGCCYQRCAASDQHCRCGDACHPLGHVHAIPLRLRSNTSLFLHPFPNCVGMNRLGFQLRHTVFFCCIVVKPIKAIPFHEIAPFPMAVK